MLLAHVRLSTLRFLIKQQAGKIAPSFYCHLRKISHHFKVNGKSLWGFWAMGEEFVQCHSSCYKRLQPKDNRHWKKKKAFGFQQMLWSRELDSKVQQCQFIDLFYKIMHALIFNLVKCECCEPSGCQWHGNIICTLCSVCEPHLANEYLVGWHKCMHLLY